MSITARCSSLPLLWQCAESNNVPDDVPELNQSGDPAECGNAVHRFLAAKVRGIDLDPGSLAREHGVDEDEVRMLCSMGLKALGELRKYLDTAGAVMQTEVPVAADLPGGVRVVGTADLLGKAGKTAFVADYKSGRLDSDYTHQLLGYGYAALETLGDVEEVIVITIWLREGVWDVERLTPAQLRSWAEEFSRRCRNGRGTFNPGEHCLYCRRGTSCPGRRELVHAAIKDLTVKGVNVIEWTPETRKALGPAIGEMYGRAKLIEKAAADFKETIRADIQQHGPLSIGGGRRLALTPVNRRSLDVAKARPVLAGWLSPAEIDAATKLSAAAAEDAAIAKAAHGQGAATKRALSAALEQAGAVTVTVTHQLRETKE